MKYGKKPPTGFFIGMGIIIGVVVGALTGSVGVWIAIGLVVGAVVEYTFAKKRLSEWQVEPAVRSGPPLQYLLSRSSKKVRPDQIGTHFLFYL